MPVLDPQVRNCLAIAGGKEGEALFLTAPVRWIEAGEDGEMTALGVGSVDGKQRQEPVATLHSLATRVASHAATFQSQRTQNVAPSSRPTTSQGQANFPGQVPAGSQSASQGQVAPTSRPTSIQPGPSTNNLSTTSLQNQPIPPAQHMQHPMQNGAPPEKISMPPPPAQIERTKTEFVTPAEEPSEIQTLR